VLKGHFAQSEGGAHLDQVHSDQKVLEMISQGRLILVIKGQESQQISSRDHQAQVYSGRKGLVMARGEAGLNKQRPERKGYTLSS
jgi:hypothetical protein